jgi:hypothetical protein
MGESQIKLTVNNFRAIESAEIELDGITVVSGENGCGKSTLSRLLYHTFKTAIDYDKLIYEEFFSELKDQALYLDGILDDVISITKFNGDISLPKAPILFNSIDDIYSEAKLIIRTIGYIKEICSSFESKISKAYYNSIKISLYKFLGENPDILEKTTLIDVLDKLYGRILSEVEDIKKKVQKRDLQKLDSILFQIFKDKTVSEKFNLYEHEACVTNRQLKRLMNVRTVESVLYIDTPMAIGLSHTPMSYWTNLNETLMWDNYNFNKENSIEKILRDDILHGNVSFDENVLDRFTYKRADGLEISLLECATGAKSFAAIQLLLKNGFFNDKTLMMIDEPEAHLHPQWIVEFARMIVLLNKELGVKFFIASHSPDMISALKYISEKEGVTPNLNFYLAEKKNPTDYTYSYRALGTNIDDIYASFNIAFDKIDLYGTVDDEVL